MNAVYKILVCATLFFLSGCAPADLFFNTPTGADPEAQSDSAKVRCGGSIIGPDGSRIRFEWDQLACDCRAIDGRDPKCWGYREYRNRPMPLGSAPEPLRAEGKGADGPEIPLDGIVNAASFMHRILAAGGVAQGAIFSIFGINIGPAVGISADSFPLGTELAGVSIRVFTLDASVQALPLFVSAGQINGIMPSNAPLGFAAVEVTFNGNTSNVAPVRIVTAGTGIFTATGLGVGPGSITNFISDTIQPLNTAVTPATPGQFVIVWLTGLGAIEASDAERPIDVGAVVDLRSQMDLEIYAGSRRVTNIFYAGRSAEFAGLDQIIFAVPDDVELGCHTPILILTNGVPSNGVTLAVAGNGAPCPVVDNPLAVADGKANVHGAVHFIRVAGSERESLEAPFVDFALDGGAGGFVEGAAAPAGFNPLLNLPPLGSCVTSVGLDSDSLVDDVAPSDASTVDAGTQVTVTRSDGEQRVISLVGDTPPFGGGLPEDEPAPLFYRGGRYRVASDGGADVVAFALDANLPEPIVWTNREELGMVSPQTGFDVQWQGGSAAQVIVVVGNSSNGTEGATASFVCTAAGTAGSLGVPPRVLANLPTGRISEDGGLFLLSLRRLARSSKAKKSLTH